MGWHLITWLALVPGCYKEGPRGPQYPARTCRILLTGASSNVIKRGEHAMGEHCDDRPRSLRDEGEREKRLKRVREPHVAELNDYVDSLRVETLKEGLISSREQIPYCDPCDGGKAALCLFVFEAPGPSAVKSGLLSRNNDDPSAQNFFELNRDAGLPRSCTTSWNVVPWALQEDGRNRNASAAEIRRGGRYLKQVLGLLPELRVVVLSGGSAHGGERFVREHCEEVGRSLNIWKMAHPGDRVRNLHPHLYAKIPGILGEVAEFVGCDKSEDDTVH